MVEHATTLKLMLAGAASYMTFIAARSITTAIASVIAGSSMAGPIDAVAWLIAGAGAFL